MLLAAYPRAAASASSIASSRYSSAGLTSGGGVDPATSFGPRHCLRWAGIYPSKPRMDLFGPGGLGIRVNFGVEALNQLASQSRPFLWRELQRRVQQLSRIHIQRLPPAFASKCSGNVPLQPRRLIIAPAAERNLAR